MPTSDKTNIENINGGIFLNNKFVDNYIIDILLIKMHHVNVLSWSINLNRIPYTIRCLRIACMIYVMWFLYAYYIHVNVVLSS